MGIKEKLPLVNSGNKGIRIVGYVVYGIVLLMVLGALVPSQETSTSHIASSSAPVGFVVTVTSEDPWSGSIDTDENTRSIAGDGDVVATRIPISGEPQVVSVYIQKQNDDEGLLKVQILLGGVVLQESETSVAYGVVTVTT